MNLVNNENFPKQTCVNSSPISSAYRSNSGPSDAIFYCLHQKTRLKISTSFTSIVERKNEMKFNKQNTQFVSRIGSQRKKTQPHTIRIDYYQLAVCIQSSPSSLSIERKSNALSERERKMAVEKLIDKSMPTIMNMRIQWAIWRHSP